MIKTYEILFRQKWKKNKIKQTMIIMNKIIYADYILIYN